MSNSNVNTMDTLNGLFREIYGDRVEKLVPKQNKLLKTVKFRANKKQGNLYHQPVVLTEESGITYANANSGAYALEESSALNMKDATVSPAQMTVRSTISIEAAQRATSGGQAAFESSTGLMSTTMIDSISKRLEIQCWYGSSTNGIGTGTTANVSTTETTVSFTTGEFSHGIWVGSTNSRLDVYDVNGVQLNTVGSTGALEVSGVDVGNKTIDITGLSGDISAIDSAAQPVTLFFRGAKGNEMVGVDTITQNQNVLFGIDGQEFDLWRGNVHDGGGNPISFASIIDAVALAVNRGLEDDVNVYLNPNAWTQLADDQASLRRYASSYKESDQTMGSKAITFYSQNGLIDVIPSSKVKEGDAFIMSMSKWARVGSTEVTFEIPGRSGSYYNLLSNSNGYEIRAYVGQSIFTHAPACSVKMTNFTI